MAAIGHAINEVVSLHRCRCGHKYEQWEDQPTPPCPTCEKTRLRKTRLEKRERESDEITDKRTKYEERADKRTTEKNDPPQETEQNPISYALPDPTPDPRQQTPGVNLITPPQAPTSRSGANLRQDSALKEAANPHSYRESREPEQNMEKSPSQQRSGRGLCNTGNTCFLNATIQCLGAIDEVNQLLPSTNQSTITQDKLLACIRELQKSGTAYTPASLIQRISHLIRYRKGDPADAHELLIALINDISEPISQIFQGQMSSTVQCSHCNKTTITTDNTQDISLHIATDSSSSLAKKLYNFFQPETLEGENAFWCEAFQEPCRATKTLSYTHIPPLEKINPGKENPEPHSLRYDLRSGALYGSRTRVIPKNGTGWHYLTPGDRKTRALCRNNKKRKRMDITQRCHNNPGNTNTPTPITGICIDV